MRKAYQFKIMIKNSHPPIWRRCVVPGGLSFSQLSVILNTVMGWSGYHPSCFEFPNLGLILQEGQKRQNFYERDFQMAESSVILIDSLLDMQKDFNYFYDFEDQWEHRVTIEKIVYDYEKSCAEVLKFRGEKLYEECGGLKGYYQILKKLEETSSGEYEKLKAWTEEHSTGEFDLDEVNEDLAYMYLSQEETEPKKQTEIYEDLEAGRPLTQILGKDYWKDYPEDDPEELTGPAREDLQDLSLGEILINYRKTELLEIAKTHGFSSAKKLNKADLVEYLERKLLSTPVMCQYFLYLSDSEYDFLQQICRQEEVEFIQEPFIDSEYLLTGGYCGQLNTGHLMITGDVRRAFLKNCGRQWEEKRKSALELLYHANAAAELYGYCSYEILLDLYKKNTGHTLSELEFLEWWGEVPELKKRFTCWNVGIVLKELKEAGVEKRLIKVQGKRPYCPMNSQEVKTLGAEGYFPFEGHMLKFKELLVKRFQEDWEDAETICRQVQYMIRTGGELQAVLEYLEEFLFLEESDMEAVAQHLLNVWNHTKRIAYRGYSPAEVQGKGLGKKEQNVRGNVSEKKQRKQERIVDFASYKKNLE